MSTDRICVQLCSNIVIQLFKYSTDDGKDVEIYTYNSSYSDYDMIMCWKGAQNRKDK